MDYAQILPEVYVGSYPASSEDVEMLRSKLGVSAVVNLQTDEDNRRLQCNWKSLQSYYRRAKMELRRVPINDYDSQQLRQKLPDGVQALNELLRDDHIVYVHCTAGMGRSPTLVVAYMYWIQQCDLDQALQYVQNCHPCNPDAEAIRRASEDLLE